MNSKSSPRSSRRGAPARASKKPRETYRHGNLRDALVTEALRLMGERPDESFTLRQVAEKIGVSHSAAYRHYPSKGALLATIAERGFELLTDALTEALQTGKTPEEIVRLQARAYVRTALVHPSHFRCMFGPRSYTKEEGRQAEAAGERAYACLEEAARRLLAESVDSPFGQSAVLAMWGIVHGFAHLALDQQLCDFAGNGAVKRYEEMADGAVGVLLSGLQRPR